MLPDHGKLMHMFLVKDHDLAAFAHLHPTVNDQRSFDVALPPLPAGDYRIYADIVFESGYAPTLTNLVRVVEPRPAAAVGADAPGDDAPAVAGHEATANDTAAPPRDPDDSWSQLPPLGAARADVFALPSGRTLRWERDGEFSADQETTLRFSVREANGRPAELEPYMGMLSHAVVTRDDGSVFVHLHPSGSINMAAQMRIIERETGATADAMYAMAQGGPGASPNTVTFPFVFPAPGPYRVFVQVKVAGAVEPASFDVEVLEV